MLGEVLVSKWAQHNGSSSFSCSLDIVVVAPRTAPAASRGSLFDGRDERYLTRPIAQQRGSLQEPNGFGVSLFRSKASPMLICR